MFDHCADGFLFVKFLSINTTHYTYMTYKGASAHMCFFFKYSQHKTLLNLHVYAAPVECAYTPAIKPNEK